MSIKLNLIQKLQLPIQTYLLKNITIWNSLDNNYNQHKKNKKYLLNNYTYTE